jgi:hypothetical protein
MKKGTPLPGYVLDAEGRVVKDHQAADRKLDICTRLKKRNSKKVRAVKRGSS